MPAHALSQLLWYKINGAIRLGYLSFAPVQQQSLLINEFPKSGASWLGEMLSDLLSMPFPRNRLPFLSLRQLFHGHYLPDSVSKKFKTIILWRDGRDVMVSLYYHSLFYNDKDNHRLVDYTRRRVPFDDYVNIQKNLPTFIDFVASGLGKPGFDWGKFERAWRDRSDLIHVKYEHLYDDCVASLTSLLDALREPRSLKQIESITDQHSIEHFVAKTSAKEAKSNDSTVPFVRRGGHGGWRTVFSKEAARRFHKSMGESLIYLGYESDDSWVARTNENAE